MARTRAVGIDLGTTFSATAWVDDAGHTNMIRNAEGDLLTPSVVMFSEHETAVGKEARTAATVHPDLVAEWVKRDMGLPYYTRPIHGNKFPPEVIQACILRKLKQDIVRELGDVDRVVITVPAYFDEPRRKCTADAGEMAGLKVLDIVNEPTAAALSFGEILGYLSPDASFMEELTLFVYDLGGGTFDATLLRLSLGSIETLATDGDVQLGGHDWDMRLAEYAADQFKREHGLDPRRDPAAMNRVLAASIEAKHALSARSRATIQVDMDGRSMTMPVTREHFEDLTADLLERTSYTTRQLLNEAGMKWKDVSRVLLVGGSTRMPMVSNMLRNLTGIEPDHTVNPDEAVARGAALFAAHLLQKENREAVSLSIANVNSHSLGVEGIDQKTQRKVAAVLIPRNTRLPAKVTERFVTKAENQRSIVLQVLEGESPTPSECTLIGKTTIRDLPKGLPKNSPVEVTFEYADNGRLTVHAVVTGTGKTASLDLGRVVGLSDSRIEKWKNPVSNAAGLNDFEAMIESVLDDDDDQDASMIRVETPKPSPKAPTKAVDQAYPADFGSLVDVVLNAPQDDFPKKKAESAKPLMMPQPVQNISQPSANLNSPLKKGTGSEPSRVNTAENSGYEVPVPLFQRTVKPAPASPPANSQQDALTSGTDHLVTPAESEQAKQEAKQESKQEAKTEQKIEISRPPQYELPVPRWIFSLAGHVVAATVGLAIGYYILSWLRPETFPPLW